MRMLYVGFKIIKFAEKIANAVYILFREKAKLYNLFLFKVPS